MKKSYTLILIMIVLRQLYTQTTIPSGNLYGTWKKSGCPYKIMGQVTIPKDSVLKIEPGVRVEFQGTYMMHVYGSLQALGKAGDTVVFTATNKTNGWQGIHLHKEKTGADSNLFAWCKFEYAKYFRYTSGKPDFLKQHGAIYLDTNNNSRFNHCVFYKNTSNNGAGIMSVRGVLNIADSYFFDNLATDERSTYVLYFGSGGSCIIANTSIVNIDRCAFVKNKSICPNVSNDSADALSAGAVSLALCYKSTVRNSNFIGNQASHFSALAVTTNPSDTVEIDNCKFLGNYSSGFPCVYVYNDINYRGTCYIKNSIFKDNRKGAIYGTLGNDFGTNIDAGAKYGTNFFDNVKVLNANGFASVGLRNPKLNRCVVVNSDSIGLYIGSNSTLSSYILNSVVANNRQSIDFANGGDMLIMNSVIAYNGDKKPKPSSYSFGGPVMSYGSSYSIINSIIQNNKLGNTLYNLCAHNGSSVYPLIRNSIIQGGLDSSKLLFGTTGSISVTSQLNFIKDTVKFVNPPKGIGPGFWDSTVDFRPVQTCFSTFAGLNIGDKEYLGFTPSIQLEGTLDLAGNPRIKCGKVDVGPYELDGAKNNISVYTEPTDQVICPRASAQLSPETCGAGINGYQWQGSSDGNSFTNINGANSLTLKTDSTVKTGDRYYRLIISQSECNKKDTSRVAKISFKPGSTIAINQQPKDTQICAGTNFNLQASISGTNNTYQWQKSSNGILFNNLSGATTNPFSQKINDSSWYRLLVTNTVCASSKDTTKAAKIIKLPLPKPNLGTDQTIPNGGNAVLNPGTFSAYNWYKGATTPTYTVDKSNLDTGKNKVWVEVTDAKGCKGRDTVIIDLRPVNGLKSIKEACLPNGQAGIKLYPVPANEILNLSVPNAANNNNYSYELRDLQGKVIIPLTHISDSNTAINLKNIPTGVYIFFIEAQGNYYSAKLMKR